MKEEKTIYEEDYKEDYGEDNDLFFLIILGVICIVGLLASCPTMPTFIE